MGSTCTACWCVSAAQRRHFVVLAGEEGFFFHAHVGLARLERGGSQEAVVVRLPFGYALSVFIEGHIFVLEGGGQGGGVQGQLPHVGAHLLHPERGGGSPVSQRLAVAGEGQRAAFRVSGGTQDAEDDARVACGLRERLSRAFFARVAEGGAEAVGFRGQVAPGVLQEIVARIIVHRAERVRDGTELHAHGVSVPVDGIAVGDRGIGVGRPEMGLALPYVSVHGGQLGFGSFVDKDTQALAPRGVILNSEGNCHKSFRY